MSIILKPLEDEIIILFCLIWLLLAMLLFRDRGRTSIRNDNLKEQKN